MNNIIKRVWNQNRMANIEDLRGMAFQAEDGGHTFEISGINDANEAVSLSGTVAGVFMRPDGTDVALTGTASDGVVSVTLSDACYAVAGRFGLYIFVTSDSKKTCVYACIGTVAQTSYGTVAGDTPQDVVDLINAINAAIASIPADYTDLMAAIAPTYSNTALYAKGAYAWYNGVLYKALVDISTAESFTAAHWETVSLADDVSELKSALNYGKTAPQGYILTATNNGNGSEWSPVGLPTDEQTQTAVITWLDAHPEATTTVQDSSLTEAKFTDELKLKTIKDYVTPEMFGAKGDGSTNDFAAINSAIAYAYQNGTDIVFTEGKTYLTESPIVIEDIPSKVVMNGSIKYIGNGVAVTFGKASATIESKEIVLNVVGNSTYTNGSVGVRLINLGEFYIKVHSINRFETGLELVGDSKGIAYNRIDISKIVSCLNHVKLNSKNGGWCNENKFFGGRFQVFSSDPFKANTIGILITSETNYYNNANTFYSPSLEGLGTAVKVEYGKLNRFYDCRTEGCNNPLDTSVESQFNIMDVSYGSKNAAVMDIIGYANRYDETGNIVKEQFSSVVFDSGNIADNVAKSGAKVAFAKLLAASNGTLYTRIDDSFDVNDGLVLSNGVNVGALIDTTHNRQFLVCPIADATFRTGVLMFAQDGTVLQDTVYGYATDSNTKVSMNKISSGRGKYIYAVSANINQDLIISLPATCKKAFFCVVAAGNSFTLKRFVVKARNLERYHTLENYDYPVLASAPTANGKTGQFVKNATPSAVAIGWVFDGTNWLAV